MFLEAMVATICIVGQNGCGSATSAYYESNQELKQTVKNVEKFGQKIVEGHEYIVYVVTPAYAIALGKPATFKITGHLNFNVDVKGNAVALQWSY